MKNILKKTLSSFLAAAMIVPALAQAIGFATDTEGTEATLEDWDGWAVDTYNAETGEYTYKEIEKDDVLSVDELRRAVDFFKSDDEKNDADTGVMTGLTYNSSTMFNYDAAEYNKVVHKVEVAELYAAFEDYAANGENSELWKNLGMDAELKTALEKEMDTKLAEDLNDKVAAVNAAISYWQKNGRWNGFYFNDANGSEKMEDDIWGDAQSVTKFPTATTYLVDATGFYKVVIPNGEYYLSNNADADVEANAEKDPTAYISAAAAGLTEVAKDDATVFTFERITDLNEEVTDEDYAYFIKVNGQYLTCVKTVTDGAETLTYALRETPIHDNENGSSVFELYSVANAATNDGSAVVLKAGGDLANWFMNNEGGAAYDSQNCIPYGAAVGVTMLSAPGHSFKLERVGAENNVAVKMEANQVFIPEGNYTLLNIRAANRNAGYVGVNGDFAGLLASGAASNAEEFTFIQVTGKPGVYYIMVGGRYLQLNESGKASFLDDEPVDNENAQFKVYRYVNSEIDDIDTIVNYDTSSIYMFGFATTSNDAFVLNDYGGTGTIAGWKNGATNELGSVFALTPVEPVTVVGDVAAVEGAEQIVIANGEYTLDSLNGGYVQVADSAIANAAVEADATAFTFERIAGTNAYHIIYKDANGNANYLYVDAGVLQLSEDGTADQTKFYIYQYNGQYVLKAGGTSDNNWFFNWDPATNSYTGTGWGLGSINEARTHFTLTPVTSTDDVYAPATEADAEPERIFGLSGLMALQSAKGGVFEFGGDNSWVYVDADGDNQLEKSTLTNENNGAATAWVIEEVRPGVYTLKDPLSGLYLNVDNPRTTDTDATVSETATEFYIYSFCGKGEYARDYAIILKAVGTGSNWFLNNPDAADDTTFDKIGASTVTAMGDPANAYYMLSVDLTEDQAKFFHVRTGGDNIYARQNIYTGNYDFWNNGEKGDSGSYTAAGLVANTLGGATMGELDLNVFDAGVFTSDEVAGKDIYENVGIPFVPVVQPLGEDSYTTYVFDASMFSARFGDSEDDIKSNTELEANTKLQYVENSGTKTSWLPYNTQLDGFANDDENADIISEPDRDYHFGMKMNINFSITENGTVTGEYTGTNGATDPNNPDITFNFEGDDDVWVFVDNQLVLDIGGIHDRIAATINFRTGDLTIENLSNMSGGALKPSGEFDYTTGNELDREGTDDTVADAPSTKNLYTDILSTDLAAFAGGGRAVHQLTIFYLERGEAESNCRITYNLIQNDLLNVTKLAEDTYYDDGETEQNNDTRIPLTEAEQAYVKDIEFGLTVNEVINGSDEVFAENALAYDDTAETYNGTWTVDAEHGAVPDANDTIVPITMLSFHSSGDIISAQNYIGTDENGNITGKTKNVVLKNGDGADAIYLLAAVNGKFYLKSGYTASFNVTYSGNEASTFKVTEDAAFGFGYTEYYYYAQVGNGSSGSATVALTDVDVAAGVTEDAGDIGINLRSVSGTAAGARAVLTYTRSAIISDLDYNDERESRAVTVKGDSNVPDVVNFICQNYRNCPEDIIVVDYDLPIKVDVDNDIKGWNTAGGSLDWLISDLTIFGAQYGKLQTVYSMQAEYGVLGTESVGEGKNLANNDGGLLHLNHGTATFKVWSEAAVTNATLKVYYASAQQRKFAVTVVETDEPSTTLTCNSNGKWDEVGETPVEATISLVKGVNTIVFSGNVDETLNGGNGPNIGYFEIETDGVAVSNIVSADMESGDMANGAVMNEEQDHNVVHGVGGPNNGTVTHTVNSNTAGVATLRVYYAAAAVRDLKVTVNDGVYTASCTSTGVWNPETTSDYVEFRVYVKEGANEIVFSGVGEGYAPNLDRFELEFGKKPTFTYTLTEELTTVEKLTYYANAVNGSMDGLARGTIYIVPATVMHYEEDFESVIKYLNDGDDADTDKYADWAPTVPATDGKSDLQDTHVIGKGDKLPYGSDTHYLTDKYDSNGSSMYVKTDATHPAQFSYTFSGTGTSFFARTGANSGFIQIVVTDNNQLDESGNPVVVYTYYRDSQYINSNNSDVDATVTGKVGVTTAEGANLYGIPLFTWDAEEDSNLGYGNYTVTVTVAKDVEFKNGYGYTENVYGTEFWLDGIRVFNPLDPTDNTTFYNNGAWSKVGEYAYLADSEYDPQTITFRDKLLIDYYTANGGKTWKSALDLTDQTISFATVATSGVFTDTNEKIDNYYEMWLNGPKEEIYIEKDQTLVFYLPYNDALQGSGAYKIYFGVKSPFGNGKVTVNGMNLDNQNSADPQNITNATECYFGVAPQVRSGNNYAGYYKVEIECSEGLIALTNIRVASNNGETNYSFADGAIIDRTA